MNLRITIDDEDVEWNGEKCISDLEINNDNETDDEDELDVALSHVLNIPFTTRIIEDTHQLGERQMQPRQIHFSIAYWIKPWKDRDERTDLCLENLQATVGPICLVSRALHAQGFNIKIDYQEHEFVQAMIFGTQCLSWDRDKWGFEWLFFYSLTLQADRQKTEEQQLIMEKIWNIFAEAFLQ